MIETPRLRLLGEAEGLPESPGAEMLVYLVAGVFENPLSGRSLEDIRSLGIPLAQALEVLHPTPYGAFLTAQGSRFRWEGESDLQELERALEQGDLIRAWSLYRALLPGFSGSQSALGEWLESQRHALRSALSRASFGVPVETVLRLTESELRDPKDRERAYMAILLRGDALLRQEKPREAVLTLGQALGLQEFGGQEFSALSLAILAHAQADWGKKAKARQTAEKALSRAPDAYTRSRACFALYRATGSREFLEASRAAAREIGPSGWSVYLEP